MGTVKIELTDQPVQVASGECYIQSIGGDFCYSFGSEPTDLKICHTDNSLYTNGVFGSLWAWKDISSTVIIIASTGE